jgi:hypothetical protein
MDQAASHSNGGRNMKKIRSGLILTTGNPGIKLISSPATTNSIGYAIFSLLAHIFNNTIAAIMAKKKGKMVCMTGV